MGLCLAPSHTHRPSPLGLTRCTRRTSHYISQMDRKCPYKSKCVRVRSSGIDAKEFCGGVLEDVNGGEGVGSSVSERGEEGFVRVLRGVSYLPDILSARICLPHSPRLAMCIRQEMRE